MRDSRRWSSGSGAGLRCRGPTAPALPPVGTCVRGGGGVIPSALRRLWRPWRVSAALTIIAALLLGFAVPEAASQTTPTFSVSISASEGVEGDSGSNNAATVTVRRANGTGSTSSVLICLTGATRGTDYRLMHGASTFLNTSDCSRLTFPSLATSVSFTLVVLGDLTAESDETITATLSNPSAGTQVSTTAGSASYTILDDDTPIVVSLERVGEGIIGEGTVITFTVTLSRALRAGEKVGVPMKIGGTGVTANNTDWTLALKADELLYVKNTGVTLKNAKQATPALLFENAGAKVATLELTPLADSREPGGETYIIELGPDGNVANGFDRPNTAVSSNVKDVDPDSDDNSFSVKVYDTVYYIRTRFVGSSVTTEGDSGHKVVRLGFGDYRGHGRARPMKLCFTGTATPNIDYRLFDLRNTEMAFDSNGCVTASLALGGLRYLILRIYGDVAPELDETVKFTVAPVADTPENFFFGPPATHTIKNDDAGIGVALSASADSVVEGESVTLTATLTHPAPPNGVVVNLERVAAHSTANFADITIGSTTTTIEEIIYKVANAIRVAPGKTTGSTTLRVTTDSDDEPPESVRIGIQRLRIGDSNSQGRLKLGSPSHVDLTVIDNTATVVTLQRGLSSAAAMNEGAGTVILIALSRVLRAGEIIDVPLEISGTNVTTGDWSLAFDVSEPRYNIGATLSGETTATPTLRFSGRGARHGRLVLSATADGVTESTSGEVMAIALGPDDATANGFDRASLGTNVDGGANPHGTLNELDITVYDSGGTIEFTRAEFQLPENNGPAQPVLRASRNIGAQTVTVTAAGGTATAGADYTGTTFTATFEHAEDRAAFRIPFVLDQVDEQHETLTMTIVASSLTGGVTVGTNGTATQTIIDSTPTEVSIARDGTAQVREGDPIRFTVTLSRALLADVPLGFDPTLRDEVIVVPLSVGGTGVTTDDWRLALRSGQGLNSGVTLSDASTATPKITFSGAGARTATLELSTVRDNVEEAHGETYSIAVGRGAAGTNVDGGSVAHSTLGSFSFWVDDSPLTGLRVLVEPAAKTTLVEEERESTEFVVRLLGPYWGNVAYSPGFGGTARHGRDYALQVWYPGRQEWITRTNYIRPHRQEYEKVLRMRIVALDDGMPEGDETVVFTIAGCYDFVTNHLPDPLACPDGVKLRGQANVTITSGDTATVKLSAAASATTEGTDAEVGVVLSRALPEDVTFRLSERHVSASSGSDYEQGPYEVTVPRGKTTATLRIPTIADGTAESDETFLVQLGVLPLPGGFTATTPNTTTVTIRDLAARTPLVSIARGTATVTEGGTATFTLTANPAPTAPLSVRVTVSDSGGFARSNQTGPRTVRIGTNGTATLTVRTVDDRVDEPNGAITVTVLKGRGYALLGSTHSATVNVDDNDTAPTPTVTISGGAAVTEGTAAAFKVSRTGSTASPLRVRLTVSETTSGGQDFVGSSNEGAKWATIPAKKSSVTYEVPTVDDTDQEADGAVTVTVTSRSDYKTLTNLDSATVTVSDDDDPPAVSFDAAASSADEDDGTVNVQVNLSPAPSSAITVSYTVGGTATAGSSGDYTIASSGSLSVPANASSVNIPVALVDDTAGEPAETVVLTLTGSGSDYTVGSASEHTLTITDDDALTVSLDRTTVTASEGTNAEFYVVLSDPPTSDITVRLEDGPLVSQTGKATKGVDYTGGPYNVTVPRGKTRALVRIGIRTDVLTAEGDETFEVTLQATGGLVVGSPATVTVTIRNATPTTPLATFATAATNADEDDGTVRVQVDLSPAPSAAINLTYSVGGTATAGSSGDFTIVSSGSSPVPANSVSFFIPVQIRDDDDDESAETVILTLTNGSGYNVGSAATHTITISDDDDPPPVVSFAQAASSVDEDAGTAHVQVTLDRAVSYPITLRHRVGGTATLGSSGDYTISGASIPAGARTARFTVTVRDDDDAERDETVALTLIPGSGYSLGSISVHTLSIVDDEAPPTVVRMVGSNDTVSEGGTSLFHLDSSPARATIVTLEVLQLSGDCAAPGQIGQRTVALGSDGRGTLAVATVDDDEAEALCVLRAVVVAGKGYSPHEQSSAIAAVADND